MKLLSIFKTPLIEFLSDERYVDVAPHPRPAGKDIPEWFKRIPAYSEKTRDAWGKPSMNAKKCLPLIDAMTLGYTIPMAIDQHVRVNGDCTMIQLGPTFSDYLKGAEFHTHEQVGGRSDLFPHEPMKFINPWIIKTPPGWSTLFIPPINSAEDRFICMGGLVDTDKYPKQVNFPARWLKPNYDGTVAAGTPLVTAIPIPRSNLNHVVRVWTKAEQKETETIARKQMTRANVYTKELRDKR